MADNDKSDKDQGMTLDPLTLKFLEHVKKGKPRQFAMICKGTSILNLVLYKKGSLEKYKKQAKENGSGQFYFGVTEGKGAHIAFRLARSDGFESEPTNDVKLKTFLNAASGGKFKPCFEMID